MRKDIIRIGTRSSRLALWQANWVKEQIEKEYQGVQCILKKIKTKGDKVTDVPLAMVGGKGLFVKEIEDALLRKEIDIAVHSMKDVPTLLPEGLHIRAITEREDFRDVLISRSGLKLEELPLNSRMGTSSLRRQSQLLHVFPDFHMIPLRGNLDTRMKKIETDGLDGIIVAAAGVRRLGLEERISEYIPPETLLPAIGQGALGIESRVDDYSIDKILDFLNSMDSEKAITAERLFLKKLEGGCQVPIAALGKVQGEILTIHGVVGSVDGKVLLRDSVSGRSDCPADLGERLAERLLARGAGDLLRSILPTTH